VWTTASVEVDDISNAGAASVHNPIVSVKWRCIPHKRHKPCPRAHIPRFPLEANQPDTPTAIPAPPRLPAQNVTPRAFIDCIMNGHDNLHVRCLRVVVFSCHRDKELSFGGIYPFFAFLSRNRGSFAGSRERGGRNVWGRPFRKALGGMREDVLPC